MDRVAVKERPVIFSGESVRQILAGRKTMTRRVVKPQPVKLVDGFPWTTKGNIKCPYGKVGDRLWVKETFQPVWAEVDVAPYSLKQPEGWALTYPATDELTEYMSEDNGITTACMSPLFMPRWASRITLEITEVRVERLQTISGDDAKAEGVPCVGRAFPIKNNIYIHQFSEHWNALNSKRGFPWDSNPWVWTLIFRMKE